MTEDRIAELEHEVAALRDHVRFVAEDARVLDAVVLGLIQHLADSNVLDRDDWNDFLGDRQVGISARAETLPEDAPAGAREGLLKLAEEMARYRARDGSDEMPVLSVIEGGRIDE